jgi:hypothetical protein
MSQESADAPMVICEKNENYIEVENEVKSLKNLRLGPQTSVIEVNYIDFPDDAKKAFQAAIDVWQSVLVSRVPIKVKAVWEPIASSTLAISGAGKVYKNFTTSAVKDTWYPSALAEAIGGKNLNDDLPDIAINVNKNVIWSFETNGTKLAGKYDLKTVILHEIAHGIGFTTSMKLATNDLQGQYGLNGFPFIYDIFVQNAQKIQLTDSKIIGNPSAELKANFTSSNIFFRLDNKNFKTILPKLYSPAIFRSGGSISHLDEQTFPKGSPNAMMSPQIGTSEINHFPGPIILAMLNQMGWSLNFFDGGVITSLPPAENSSKIFVYPNPSSDYVNLILPERYTGKPFVAKVFNKVGLLLLNENHKANEFSTQQVNIQSLVTGNYILVLENQDGIESIDFIKL